MYSRKLFNLLTYLNVFNRSIMPSSKPSLYAAIRLARLVQHFKERLKARVKSHRLSSPPEAVRQHLQDQALDKLTGTQDLVQSQHLSHHVGPRSGDANGLCHGDQRVQRSKCQSDIGITVLLRDLEAHARLGRKKLSKAASRDALFLKCDVRRLVTHLPLERFGCIIDLSTSIIDQLQPADRTGTGREGSPPSDHHAKVGCRSETWVANLLHLLLCLRALAYELLIKMRMKLLMPIIKDWYLEWDQERISHQSEWQQQKIANRNQTWFAEWPGRRPPLNTTWPWLVKPSLMVLWGVCWMFYGDDAYQPNPAGQDRHTQRGHQLEMRRAGQRVPQGADFAAQSHSHGMWGGDIAASQPDFVPSDLAPASMIGQPYQGIHNSGSNASSSAASNRASSASHQYINSTSGVSSSPFAPHSALQTTLWPQDPPLNIHAPSLGPDIHTWQPQPDFTRFHTSTPLYPQGSPAPHAATFPLHPIARASSFPNGSYQQDHQRPFLPKVGMSDYPSPQHSEVSEQAICTPTAAISNNFIGHNSYPLSNRSNMSTTPVKQQDQPAAGASPPQNLAGEIYCADPSCRSNPPIFARKCEWTKHTDKHTRPHRCKHPDCDKIQGFTYSGGLLRHQREVHNHHGGPKTLRMCPFKDCKRSAGPGFSRKENLNEHIRRVHRDTNKTEGTSPENLLRSSTSAERGERRRKRERSDMEEGEDDAEGDEDAEDQRDLGAMFKKLKRESQAKDERLRSLEEQVKSLTAQLRSLQVQQGGPSNVAGQGGGGGGGGSGSYAGVRYGGGKGALSG